MIERSGAYVHHFDQALAESIELMRKGQPYILFTFGEEMRLNTACIACSGEQLESAVNYLAVCLLSADHRHTHMLLTDYPEDEEE